VENAIQVNSGTWLKICKNMYTASNSPAIHDREVNTKAMFIILANNLFSLQSQMTAESLPRDPPHQQGIPAFLFPQENLLLSCREIQYRYQELFADMLIVVC
jgi:hypothetical protein